MIIRIKALYRLAIITLISVLLMPACTTHANKPSSTVQGNLLDGMIGEIERDTYHQILLREDMRAMTISVRKLLVLDAQTDISAEDRHRQVMRELDELEGTATVIREDEEISNYSLLSPYLGSFLHDVSMAREYAEQTPPDYQPATWLIKSCLFCHKNL